MSSLKSNTLLCFISLGSKLCSNIVVLMALGRFLKVADYGLFTYAFTITNIAIVFVDYGFNIHAIKHIAAEQNKAQRYVAAASLFKLFLVLIMLCGIVGFGVLSHYDENTWKVVLLLSLGAIFNSFSVFYGTVYRGLNRFAIDTITSIIANIVFVLFVMLSAYLTRDVLIVSYAFLAARFVYFAISIGCIIKNSLLVMSISSVVKLKNIYIESLPFGIHALFGALYFNSDTIIVNEVLSITDVATYQAVCRIVMGIIFIAEVLTSAFYPELVRTIGDKERFVKISKKYLSLCLIISLCSILVLTPYAKEILNIVYGGKYQYAENLLRILGFSVPIKYLGYYYGTLLTAIGMQYIRANTAIVASIISIGLNVALTGSYGLCAPAWVTLIVNSFVLLMFMSAYAKAKRRT